MEQEELVSKFRESYERAQRRSEDILSIQNIVWNIKYYAIFTIILNSILYLFSRYISFWKLIVIFTIMHLNRYNPHITIFNLFVKQAKRLKKENEDKYINIRDISAIMTIIFHLFHKLFGFVTSFRDTSMIYLSVKLFFLMMILYLDCLIGDYGIMFIILNFALAFPYAIQHRRSNPLYPNDLESLLIKSSEM